jgi:arylsulfatase
LAGSNALALEITGTPGSPSATTTLPGNQLPPPAPKFGGVIKVDALHSTPLPTSTMPTICRRSR